MNYEATQTAIKGKMARRRAIQSECKKLKAAIEEASTTDAVVEAHTQALDYNALVDEYNQLADEIEALREEWNASLDSMTSPIERP